MLDYAIHLAREAHAGQVDKAGAPYIDHPIRVLEAVRRAGGNEIEQIVAVLHDVIEDHPDFHDLIVEHFPAAVIDALALVTRRKSERYADFITRIAASKNRVAIAVKLADLHDNLHRESIAKFPTLAARYQRAVARLQATW